MRLRHATILRVVRFALLLAAVLAAAMFLRSTDWRTIPAGDQSMDPTYPGGTRIMAEVLAADAPLERGDDVVYEWVQGSTTYERFGRIRGLPGDEIGEQGGQITVNGALVGPIPIPGEAMGRVPEGRVLILAINPAEKRYPDSRDPRVGFVPRSQIVARIRSAMH